MSATINAAARLITAWHPLPEGAALVDARVPHEQVGKLRLYQESQIRLADRDEVISVIRAFNVGLTDGLSADEPDHFHAYRELLVTDNLQFVDANGVLTDVTQVIGQDANGDDIVVTVPQPSPASIAGARASSDFFDRFNDPNDLHFNILSRAEQRLIAEWLDVGAQYYNNPFDAPAN